jgi:glycosyltransferase involved in cell wall biosynthesis
MEAMAMGKAIVASDIGWAPELITDGIDGLLVHPTQHSKFATKVVELLESETMRKQFGDAARQHCIRSFDGMDIAKKSVQFYSTHLS